MMFAGNATYALWHFMKYPNLAFQLAMTTPFTWQQQQQGAEMVAGAAAIQHNQRLSLNSILANGRHLWFIFGAINLIYQNIGMLVYLLLPQAMSSSSYELPFITQISETGGVMGLTLVGACKMFILFWHSKRISKLLTELQAMFPSEQLQRRQAGCLFQKGKTIIY